MRRGEKAKSEQNDERFLFRPSGFLLLHLSACFEALLPMAPPTFQAMQGSNPSETRQEAGFPHSESEEFDDFLCCFLCAPPSSAKSDPAVSGSEGFLLTHCFLLLR